MFLLFVLVTLGITYWAARKSQSAAAFFTASRRITGWQNGVAVAGDYMSAASFLGIAGLIAFFGYDGFMFSVGWLVAYLTVLLVVAEPLRNAGKYDGGCARLSSESAAGSRDGGVEHDHSQHVLHDRADGGRGGAGHVAPGQLARELRAGGHRRRRADDYLRRVWRNAGDDLGADHQGDPAHGRNDSAQLAGAGAFRLEPQRVSSRP